MIDLSEMRAVRVDPQARRAWVAGGATWREVDRETQAFGLAVPGGLISDTGVAGLTLSGGIGWLRSRHGLCIDNLVGADVVTADGSLVHTSATENAGLLWALQGGGGNFGVVTSFEFALHQVGPTLMFSAPLYAVRDGSAPIRFWRDFLADAVIDKIMEGNEHPPSPNTLTWIWNFGGATARVGAAETAFGDRSMPYMFSIDSIWERAEQDEANIAWTRSFWERMQPHSDRGRIYLNFPGLGEEGDEVVRRTFGGNFERLGQIKMRYDPTNLFRCNQNIPPAT